MQDYDQMTDRDDLMVARDELQTLYDYEQNNGDDDVLHGLDVAITVLGKVIDSLPAEGVEEYEATQAGAALSEQDEILNPEEEREIEGMSLKEQFDHFYPEGYGEPA